MEEAEKEAGEGEVGEEEAGRDSLKMKMEVSIVKLRNLIYFWRFIGLFLHMSTPCRPNFAIKFLQPLAISLNFSLIIPHLRHRHQSVNEAL